MTTQTTDDRMEGHDPLFPWTCSCGCDHYHEALSALRCRECRKEGRAMRAIHLFSGEKRYISYYFKTPTPRDDHAVR